MREERYGWWVVGKYRVLSLPRSTHDRWVMHRIYLVGKLLGSQFSIPSEADCVWHEKWGGRYADAVTSAVYGWTAKTIARRKALA